jgi:hypothetical protein
MYEEVIGTVSDIQPGPAGLRVTLRLYDGTEVPPIDVTGIVVGTGFVKSAFAIPVIRRLVQTYNVPVEYERIKLKTNCGVAPLDRPDSRLCAMGLISNTVVPNADTIAGLKYQARRFVGDCFRAENVKARSFPSRFSLQMKLARQSVKSIRQIRKTQQLA